MSPERAHGQRLSRSAGAVADRTRQWAHRRGLARILSTTSGGMMGEQCSAYIETRGPAWLGRHLWRFALLSAGTAHPRPDLDTLRVAKRERLSRFRFRWQVSFGRVWRD